MARKAAKPKPAKPQTGDLALAPLPPVPRTANGTFQKGFSGLPGGDAGRARRALNVETIKEMHRAFREGGQKAIRKVMLNQPAIFLKLLVLLVPRELEVTHSQGAKGMSDEQLDAAIAAIEEMLAKRAGDDAQVIEASPVLPQEEPPPPLPDGSAS